MGPASLIRRGAALVAVIAIAACRSGPDQAPPASPPVPASTQPLYLCCNVRPETDWLSDGGFLVGRVIPAGTPVKLLGSSRGVANVEIDIVMFDQNGRVRDVNAIGGWRESVLMP